MSNAPRDPVAARQRKKIAQRRAGVNAKCAHCAETRPDALIPGTMPKICAARQRLLQGHPITDDHHPAGKNNSPVTLPVHINDHRAELSTRQHDWPSETLRNPQGDPLLKAAGRLRGYRDTVGCLDKTMLPDIPELVEFQQAFMREKYGSRWWEHPEIKEFAWRKGYDRYEQFRTSEYCSPRLPPTRKPRKTKTPDKNDIGQTR